VTSQATLIRAGTPADPAAHLMFIDGQWVPASDGRTADIIDPATEQVIATTPKATPADVHRAIEAARRGWLAWREASPWDRSDCLRGAAAYFRAHEDELAALMTAEQGKPIREASAELRSTWQQFEWFADEARRIHGEVTDLSGRGQYAMVLRESIGPVAAFAPWNFPALLPVRKVAPALAAGCSVVFKPADETPGIGLAIAAALESAGLPPGVLNVLTGDAAGISGLLLGSPVIRKLTFTGSVPVGQQLLRAAADRIVNTTMELGGHAPVIVTPDVDIEAAAQLSVAAKYRNGGQVCISPTRFYVHSDIFEPYCEAFVAGVSDLAVGDGADPGTDVGPLGNARRVTAVDGLVQQAHRAGARIAVGGQRIPRPGYFYQPTVLLDVPDAALIMTEEPFGPVAPLLSYDDLDDVLRRANATQFGLAGYVLARDLQAALGIARRLEVGMVGINQFALSHSGIHFGGVKFSGIGSESGSAAMDAYLVNKAVHIGEIGASTKK
jgi:succinate-semialdehyde dehydrogenase/glutarate-semialdehyde dehydrogenase